MHRQPPPERRLTIARAGLASLKSIAGTGGAISERARSFMREVREHLLHVDVDLDALVPIGPADRKFEAPSWVR